MGTSGQKVITFTAAVVIFHIKLTVDILSFDVNAWILVLKVECFTIYIWKKPAIFKINFNFEVILNLHAGMRNNTENSHVDFIEFLPKILLCRIIAQCHYQDVDSDTLHRIYLDSVLHFIWKPPIHLIFYF